MMLKAGFHRMRPLSRSLVVERRAEPMEDLLNCARMLREEGQGKGAGIKHIMLDA